MEFLKPVLEWWGWFVGLAAVGAAAWLASAFGHFELACRVYRKVINWIKMRWTRGARERQELIAEVRGIKEGIVEATKRAEQPMVSPDAKFCPNCDTRMLAGWIYGDTASFSCPQCKFEAPFKLRQ